MGLETLLIHNMCVSELAVSQDFLIYLSEKVHGCSEKQVKPKFL